MVIVIIAEWFSENMGYAENFLPKAFSKSGCDVHLVTSNFQVYATNAELYKIYEPYLGKPIVDTGQKKMDGYMLHRLPNYQTKYGTGLKGLFDLLKKIQPVVVYLFEINNESTLQAVKYKPLLKYKIFTESRLHLSIYEPPKTLRQKLHHHFKERLKWKKIGKSFEKCYPVAPDVLQVICKYFGQDKKKCVVASLAVDTDIFKPLGVESGNIQRNETRKKMGFSEIDIVCIYTGRFTEAKGTIILARAIDHLHKQGHTKFKGLFVGTGDEDYKKNISQHAGCCIQPFVPSSQLATFYQVADIGVWPKQESTSQLDAIACGLPIIISSRVEDIDRIKGNGISYLHEDPIDLASKILSLDDPATRLVLSAAGIDKVKKFYSWDYIASLRLKDFRQALSK